MRRINVYPMIALTASMQESLCKIVPVVDWELQGPLFERYVRTQYDRYTGVYVRNSER